MTTLTILCDIDVTLCICSASNNIYFFSALEQSRVKWNNSRNSTQKMRTQVPQTKIIIHHHIILGIFSIILNILCMIFQTLWSFLKKFRYQVQIIFDCSILKGEKKRKKKLAKCDKNWRQLFLCIFLVYFGRPSTLKLAWKKKECMIASQTVQWGDIRVCSITRPFVVFLLLLRLDIFFAQFIVATSQLLMAEHNVVE